MRTARNMPGSEAAPGLARGECLCGECNIMNGNKVADLGAWLATWAPRKPRETPRSYRYAHTEALVLEHGW